MVQDLVPESSVRAQGGDRRRCDDRARPWPRSSSSKGAVDWIDPTDRGKHRSKIHVICHHNGLPLSVGISGANLHDSQALIPLMRGILPIRSRHGPRRCRVGGDAAAAKPPRPIRPLRPPRRRTPLRTRGCGRRCEGRADRTQGRGR
ncbi:transposase [Streptomyces virginiae]|nr:transposase [Streptomyces virginiae]MCX5276849.1 transposase [Streptomyces virginiae]